jgi:nucleoside phosphorylase
VPELKVTRQPLFGGMTNVLENDRFFLAGPFLGAPQAVMILEILGRYQAKEFIFLGFAGSLSNRLNPGDLFMPTAGISTEGTSAHYPGELTPDPELAEHLLSISPTMARGLSWTTDAPFRETLNIINEHREKKADTVDMESAALMAAARFRGLKLAVLLVISDIFGPEDWKSYVRCREVRQGWNRAFNLAREVLLHRHKRFPDI